MNIVDAERLRKKFEDFECHGVVALVNSLILEQQKGIEVTKVVGSSSIGFGEIMNENWISEDARIASAWFRTRSLYIGSKDGSVTPLEWLEKLSEIFEHLPTSAQKRFDELCIDLAKTFTIKPSGDVEIHGRDGIFKVPQESYSRGMTDEEIEPFRVEKSEILDTDSGSCDLSPFLEELAKVKPS